MSDLDEVKEFVKQRVNQNGKDIDSVLTLAGDNDASFERGRLKESEKILEKIEEVEE